MFVYLYLIVNMFINCLKYVRVSNYLLCPMQILTLEEQRKCSVSENIFVACRLTSSTKCLNKFIEMSLKSFGSLQKIGKINFRSSNDIINFSLKLVHDSQFE